MKWLSLVCFVLPLFIMVFSALGYILTLVFAPNRLSFRAGFAGFQMLLTLAICCGAVVGSVYMLYMGLSIRFFPEQLMVLGEHPAAICAAIFAGLVAGVVIYVLTVLVWGVRGSLEAEFAIPLKLAIVWLVMVAPLLVAITKAYSMVPALNGTVGFPYGFAASRITFVDLLLAVVSGPLSIVMLSVGVILLTSLVSAAAFPIAYPVIYLRTMFSGISSMVALGAVGAAAIAVYYYVAWPYLVKYVGFPYRWVDQFI